MNRQREMESRLNSVWAVMRNSEIGQGNGGNGDREDMPKEACSVKSNSVRMDQSALNWPSSRK